MAENSAQDRLETAAYVRPDVDLDWAADEIVDGAVFNSVQSCCSLERVYVHEKVHDDFVKAVQKVLAMGYDAGRLFCDARSLLA